MCETCMPFRPRSGAGYDLAAMTVRRTPPAGR
jgi:hypothetical protein